MNPDQTDEYYLTVAEVAQMLRLNQQTVRNWIDQGSLPALRVGRRVRIKRSDLDRILAEGYSAGSQAEPDAGPSAEDFWGGEPVGVAEPTSDGSGNGAMPPPGATTDAAQASNDTPASSDTEDPTREVLETAASADRTQ